MVRRLLLGVVAATAIVAAVAVFARPIPGGHGLGNPGGGGGGGAVLSLHGGGCIALHSGGCIALHSP